MSENTFEFSALKGSTSLHRAHLGDLSLIIERVRDGSTLLEAERHLIADILSGSWTRPANRPPAFDVELRTQQIKEDLLLNRALDPKGRPGATRVAHAYECSRKWVYKLLAEVEADPKGHAEMHRRVAHLAARYRSLKSSLDRELASGSPKGDRVSSGDSKP
ncbi:hypothetical protein [Brevundimonas sp. TWP3-1-2b1]|uniref:hypothetical protein n=1 Tax=Brevundimonas sp. TWP3-1-2b1 TaxID=2804650 RepID=UPI003CE875B7